MASDRLNRILVTGASGFVGEQLISQLSKSGDFEIRAVVRNPSVDYSSDHISTIHVDNMGPLTDWSQALESVDIVIHLAARVHFKNETSINEIAEYRKVNVDATVNLARQAAENGVKRFIFISSVKAAGEQSGQKAFTENDICLPEDEYGKSKLHAENALKKLFEDVSTELVIIRPPLIYGAGVKANFRNLLSLCNKPIPLPFGAINNKRSLVYLENLIDFIETCCNHPNAASQLFYVSDDQAVSTTDIIRTIKKALKKPAMLPAIPHHLLVRVLNILGKKDLAIRLLGNLELDITKAKTLLGWHPPFTFEQGIQKTVETYLENKRN